MEGDPSGVPLWIKYLRKTLLEELHSTPHLLHILQLIVRHSKLFYCARGHFLTHVRPLRPPPWRRIT